MSTNLALARPLRRPAPETTEAPRHLEVAASRAQRRARPKVVYALIVVAGIGVILFAQLLLSIALADGAYRISSLQTQQRDYTRQQESLQERLDVLGSTQNLTTRAEDLGMVKSGYPVFLDAGTGAVTGTSSDSGGSLVGASGNLVGNSLLKGDGVDDQAVQDAQEQNAAQTPTTEEDGGIATTTGGSDTGTTATGTTGGSSGGGTGANVPSAPGVIPSPTTH